MKHKIKKLIIISLIVVLSLSMLIACNKVDSPKGYVVISFVTNCDFMIQPIILDGSEVDMPQDPFRAGYNFGGWYYDQLFTAEFQSSNGFSNDTTLYAKWISKSVVEEQGNVTPDKKDELGFSYNLMANGNYEVVLYKGDAKSITIPDSFKDVPVQRIGNGAFKNNSTLTEIKFGWEINSIGEEAFRNCSALANITPKTGNNYFIASDGVLYNKERSTIIAFCSGSDNTSVVVDKDVVIIRKYSFSLANINVTFADNCRYNVIQNFAFAEFAGQIMFNKNIIEISKDSFSDASCEIVFGDDCAVTDITNGAFANYKGEKLIIPRSVQSISYQPFNNCTAIVDLSKSSLTTLGNQAFASYKGKTLLIPLSVDTLESNCFYQCSSAITFQSGSLLKIIGEQAFNSFFGEVVFASGITEIKDYAFYCASIKAHIKFSDRKEDIAIIEADAFKGNKATVIFV